MWYQSRKQRRVLGRRSQCLSTLLNSLHTSISMLCIIYMLYSHHTHILKTVTMTVTGWLATSSQFNRRCENQTPILIWIGTFILCDLYTAIRNCSICISFSSINIPSVFDSIKILIKNEFSYNYNMCSSFTFIVIKFINMW